MRAGGGILRGLLAAVAPDLHALLARQWEIALDAWLPAISVRQDCYHSYPHLRNVERHLDALIVDTTQSPVRLRVELSPIEQYVLLAAVLFHDLGRGLQGGQRGQHHGRESEALLRKSGSSLGFPSEKLAELVGRICAFHSLGEKEREEQLRRLRPETIDPFGRVDLRTLAVLLFVADHMDSAHTRVLPSYLVFDKANLGAIGAFRNAVQGVRVDHNAKLICTVLDRTDHQTRAKPDWSRCEYRAADLCRLPRLRDLHRQDEREGRKQKKEIWHSFTGGKLPWAKLAAELPADDEPAMQAARIDHLVQHGGFDAVDWLVAHKELEVRPKCNGTRFRWHRLMIVAMVLGDVLVNHRAIRSVRNVLADVGLPLGAWLLEHQDRLYNTRGQETYEPVFSRRYLCSVAEGMWELNKHVFGSSCFTYQNLADMIQDPELTRVKMVVRRLSAVLSDPPTDMATGLPRVAIQAGRDRWQLVAGPGGKTENLYSPDSDQKDPGLEYLRKAIKYMKEPIEHGTPQDHP